MIVPPFICLLSAFLLLPLLPQPVPLATPTELEVSPSSYSSLRVSWAAAAGATHYMILYSALNNGEPEDAKEVLGVVRACVCVRVYMPGWSFLYHYYVSRAGEVRR